MARRSRRGSPRDPRHSSPATWSPHLHQRAGIKDQVGSAAVCLETKQTRSVTPGVLCTPHYLLRQTACTHTRHRIGSGSRHVPSSSHIHGQPGGGTSGLGPTGHVRPAVLQAVSPDHCRTTLTGADHHILDPLPHRHRRQRLGRRCRQTRHRMEAGGERVHALLGRRTTTAGAASGWFEMRSIRSKEQDPCLPQEELGTRLGERPRVSDPGSLRPPNQGSNHGDTGPAETPPLYLHPASQREDRPRQVVLQHGPNGYSGMPPLR